MCLTMSLFLYVSHCLPLKLIMNNYIVAVPDAGVAAVLLVVVPVLRLDIALGADTGGGGGRGLVTGGVVTGGGRGRGLVIGGESGDVTGGKRGRGLVTVGGSGPVHPSTYPVPDEWCLQHIFIGTCTTHFWLEIM